MKPVIRKSLTIVAAAGLLLLLAEAIHFGLIAAGVVLISNPYAFSGYFVSGDIAPDIDRSFFLKSCPHRFMRIIKGQLIFDGTSCVNKQGFRSPHDYDAPVDSALRRVAVLGDSFTHMWYAARSWPETLEQSLSTTQVDSYALAGIGIENWHRIYFKHIRQRRYTDLVIASYTTNLARPLSIVFTKDGGYYQAIFRTKFPDSLEAALADPDAVYRFGSQVPLRSMDWIAEYAQGKSSLVPLDFYLTRFVLSQIVGDPIAKPAPPVPAPMPMPDDSDRGFAREERLYGPRKVRLLRDILDDAKKSGVRIWLAAVPSREGILMRNSGQPTAEAAMLGEMAEEACIGFFDGHEAFLDLPRATIERDLFLPIDGHWRPEGADIFARALAERMNQPPPDCGNYAAP